ncbi:hypothetical protein NEHOM01_0425 [Nematocida homosporus]|uniref:uncharacterized protein n=1 Tax=Nematocida homosporus TaxID=1912981 RepID=UPI00221E4074|nr:uncharacterized protein NEHOM01_0425 [Nematocida homosporus]KAI5184823.1 hypothetical protein NEHOM01_0425 [Nematocida homosporus]
MSRHQNSSLCSLAQFLLFLLGICKTVVLTQNATNNTYTISRHSSFAFSNGLSSIAIVCPGSSDTYISIAFRKRFYANISQYKYLGIMLEEILKCKISLETSRSEYSSFMAQPEGPYTIKHGGYFITINFSLTDPGCLAPLQLLQSIITTPLSLEVFAEAKTKYQSSPTHNGSTSNISDDSVMREWNATFCFPNTRIAIVAPEEPSDIVAYLFRQYHHNQHYSQQQITKRHEGVVSNTHMHTFLFNSPQLLISRKSIDNVSNMTIFIPLFNSIIVYNKQILIFLYQLFNTCYEVFKQEVLTPTKEFPTIKTSLVPLEAAFCIRVDVQISAQDPLRFKQIIDLIKMFFCSIKRVYQNRDSKLIQIYNKKFGESSSIGMLLNQRNLAYAAAIQLFLAQPSDISAFFATTQPSPINNIQMNYLLIAACNRRNWYIKIDIHDRHFTETQKRADRVPSIKKMLAPMSGKFLKDVKPALEEIFQQNSTGHSQPPPIIQVDLDDQINPDDQTDLESQITLDDQNDSEYQAYLESQITLEDQADSEAQTELESQINPDDQVDPEDQTDLENQIKLEYQNDSEYQAYLESQITLENQADSEAQTELESQITLDGQIDPESQTDLENQIKLEYQVDSEDHADLDNQITLDDQVDSEDHADLDNQTNLEYQNDSEYQAYLKYQAYLESQTNLEYQNDSEYQTRLKQQAYLEYQSYLEYQAYLESQINLEDQTDSDSSPITISPSQPRMSQPSPGSTTKRKSPRSTGKHIPGRLPKKLRLCNPAA